MKQLEVYDSLYCYNLRHWLMIVYVIPAMMYDNLKCVILVKLSNVPKSGSIATRRVIMVSCSY